MAVQSFKSATFLQPRGEDNVDFDATPIIRGEQTIQEMGEGLYEEILAVATGKLTVSEIHGHFEA